MEQPGAILYYDLADAIDAMTDEQAGRLLKAVMRSRTEEPDFSDDPVLKIVWLMTKPKLDADKDRYSKKCAARAEAGRVSGERRRTMNKREQNEQVLNLFSGREQNEQNEPTQPNSTQPNSTQPNSTQPNSNSIIAPAAQTPTEETPEKPKTVRHQYGAYKNVLLSDEEFSKLVSEFPDYEARIERLSEYIASKGARYKSHLATIRAWARKDGQTARDSQRTMDADELDAIRRALEE